MKTIIFLALAFAAFAQNPNTATFPTAVATDAELLAAKRISQSTLAAAITTTGGLSVTVADGTQFINYEVVRIDNEELKVCSVSGATLTICSGGRGFNGTTAATHSNGATVRGIITSWHHNQMAAEVKAIEGRVADLAAYCRSTTGNDTYTCATVPPLSAYSTGRCIVLNADTANTTGATVQVGALAAVAILTRAGAALATGDITANQPITMCYNGTAFVVQGDGASGGDVTAAGDNTFTGYNNFSGASIRFPETTVAGLPAAASNTGKIYVVTDATSSLSGRCTSGGGATRAACISTGSAWISIQGDLTNGFGITQSCSAGSCTLGLDSDVLLKMPYCASTSASATIYACALPSIALYVYSSGVNVTWNVGTTACTGGVATTLNIDTVGAKRVFKMDGTTDPAANDCTANRRVLLSYDSTLDAAAGGWRILNEYVSASGGWDPGSNGMLARTGAGTTAARTITGSTGVTVTNGDGSANPTISADTAVVETRANQQINGSTYSVTAGTSTVYTVALTPTATSSIHTPGAQIRIKMDETCGASPTINVDSQGAKGIYKRNGTTAAAAIGTGELIANQTYVLTYNNSLAAGSGGWETDIGGGGSSATAGAGLTNTSGTWSWNPLDPTIRYIDGSFCQGTLTKFSINHTGQVSWYFNELAGTVTANWLASDSNRVCPIRLTTGATGSSAVAIAETSSGAAVNEHYGRVDTGTWKAIIPFRLNQSASQTVRIGFDSDNAAGPGAGGGILLEVTGADTNYFFKSCSDATTCSTRIDSGVAVNTNWHLLTMGRDGTNVYACLDACASPSNFSTNIPTANLKPKLYLRTDNSTAMSLDTEGFRYLRVVTPY